MSNQFKSNIVKQFSRLSLAAVITLGLSGLLMFVSCKDKCGSTTCQNGATCSSNVCVCATGYSGNACQTAWSDRYVTTYNCYKGSCTPATSGPATWTSAITKSSTNGGYTIVISNFASSNIAVTATVDTFGTIRVDLPSGSYGISGHGTLVNNTITMDYSLSTASGAGAYNCSFTMVRQ